MHPPIRPADINDFAAILALNEESVHFLSPLDLPRLSALHAQAALHRVVEVDDRVAAFLLAFREHADYDSPNYLWFEHRYETFLYIDRVVVGRALQGTGLGRRLYQDAFAEAQRSAVPRLTCEFDIDPPNPVSAGFHAGFGFVEVGRQSAAGGKKQVSLQCAPVKA